MATHPTPSPEGQRQRRQLLIALAGGTVLSACGGGEDTADPQSQPNMHPLGIGAGGTGYRTLSFLSAAVTTVSPLGVGGVQLTGAGARLCDGDGNRLRENEVELGMTARVQAGRIVSVRGRRRAQAQSVVVDTQVRGPATWVDARNLLILGQRVYVGPQTPQPMNGIGAGGTGQSLSVWGQLDLFQGRFVASRVDQARPGDRFMLRGVLSAIDRSSGVVQVGSLRARAAAPTLLPAGVAVGAVVRLLLGTQAPGGEWDLLELRDDALRPPNGVTTELEGRVTQFTDAQHFALDGVVVDATQARIEGLASLAAGAEVSVEGTMRNGVLLAREVSAEAAEPVEFEGLIDGVDPLGQTVSVGGWLVHWSAATRFAGGSAGDLQVGRKLAGLARWVPGQAALEASRLSVEK